MLQRTSGRNDDPGESITICVTGLRGFPNVMGGVESHCEELLPRIKAIWPEHRSVVLGRAPYLPERESEYKGVEIVGVPCPRSKHLEAILSTFLAVLTAWWRGAAVIHIHAIGPGMMAPLAYLLGMQVVVTHHGTDYNRAKWGRVARTALRSGEWLALAFAHRIIAISPSLATQLRENFPKRARDISYIPNGAPALPEGADPELVLERIGITGPFLLAVGRLVPEKGLHDLIAAFERSGSAAQLVIVGGADHQSGYARELMAQAGDRVVFAGVQSRATLKCLYERCELFVMPSHHEGLPIAALEAASCGARMLLSDIAANRDIGLDARNYFPVGNVDALMRRLDEGREDLAVDAEHVRDRFSWDRAAIDTIKVYQSALRKCQPSSATSQPAEALD
ncbi:glycosyltransferase family 4 protein [Sphingomonas sp. dw_22]|uniref:glycosyltransferase family 4 protein n=1 Tax=Sphingomonas sp. dw_22 TaxID=2721175 RepID=UPI001BD3EE40|nr:glycosyltransferase family 4 protein [Sphingomonas sp. dw_22]